MKKIILVTLILLSLFISIASAQSSWEYPHQFLNHTPEVNDNDYTFTTDSVFQIINVINFDESDIFGGNFDDDATTKELLIVPELGGGSPSSALFFFNATFASKSNVSLEGLQTLSHDYQTGVYDYDSDGTLEIIILFQNSSKQYIRVFDFSGGIWSQPHSGIDISVGTGGGALTPTCTGGFCYFVDATGRIYKYSPSANTISSINVAGGAIDGSRYRITIADCDPFSPGEEIVYILDTDGSIFDEIGVIPLNNFTSGATRTFDISDNSELVDEKIYCNNFLGNTTLFVPRRSGTTPGFNFRVDGYKILSNSTMIRTIAVNTSYASVIVYPDVSHNIVFTDADLNGQTDFCSVFNYFPSLGDDHVVFVCYNSSGVVRTADRQFQANTNTGNNVKSQAYVFDIDNDGKDEIISMGAYFNVDTQTTAEVSFTQGGDIVLPKDYAFLNYGDSECVNWYYTGYSNTATKSYYGMRQSTLGSCNFTETVSIAGNITVKYNETFGTTPSPSSPFNPASCLQAQHTGVNFSGWATFTPSYDEGNFKWVCWENQTTESFFEYSQENSTNIISTIYGIGLQQNSSPQFTTGWANLHLQNIPLGDNDIINFTCRIINSSSFGLYPYFLIGSQEITNNLLNASKSAYISLRDGGCEYNGSIPYSGLGNIGCCELSDMTGYDCMDGKVNVSFSKSDITNNCPDINDTAIFTDIDRFEFLTLSNGSTGIANFYFDDLLIYNLSQPPSPIPPAPPSSFNCTGFTSPSCTGTCYFFDNFNYNFSIRCNNWFGASTKFPDQVAQKLALNNTGMDGNSIYLLNTNLGNDPIFSQQYDTFTTSFNFIIKDSSQVEFFLLDSDINNFITIIFWNNFNLYALTNSNPSVLFLGNFTQDTEHLLEMTINFRQKEVTIRMDSNDLNNKIVNFYDNPADNFGYASFTLNSPLSNDIRIDDFTISYGDANPEDEGEPITTQVSYTYNPALFCAINWTSNDSLNRFIPQNCVDRGYSIHPNLLGLCVPRACFQDTTSAIFQWAMSNIFVTIILVIGFILVAPIFIALVAKIR